MNKKMSALGGKITPLIILIAMMSMGSRYFTSIAMAELGPNYGTTTFFSEANEIPSANPPIYDVGVNATNNNSSNDSKKNEKSNNNNDGGDDGGDGLFNNVITSINNFFGGSVEQTEPIAESLFDWQQDSNMFGDSTDSIGGDGEFVMGARGESLENIDDEEAAKYNSRLADGFNFREKNASSAPKKSKLLFTNIIVPVDLTTQYIIIGFIFFIAIGLTVGYYFWKKETATTTVDPDEDYQ